MSHETHCGALHKVCIEKGVLEWLCGEMVWVRQATCGTVGRGGWGSRAQIFEQWVYKHLDLNRIKGLLTLIETEQENDRRAPSDHLHMGGFSDREMLLSCESRPWSQAFKSNLLTLSSPSENLASFKQNQGSDAEAETYIKLYMLIYIYSAYSAFIIAIL